MRHIAQAVLVSFGVAACAATGGPGSQAGEAEYLAAVHRGEEPGEIQYLMEESAEFRVGIASGPIDPNGTEYQTVRRVEQAAQDSLAESVRPWVLSALEDYAKWFSWSERRPQSELVQQHSQALARGAIKVFDRFYHQIGQYQCALAIHRTEVEINIIGDAISREHQRGGSDIPVLLNRMNDLQSRFVMVSDQLRMMRAP